jgi:hypothetical protein
VSVELTITPPPITASPTSILFTYQPGLAIQPLTAQLSITSPSPMPSALLSPTAAPGLAFNPIRSPSPRRCR